MVMVSICVVFIPDGDGVELCCVVNPDELMYFVNHDGTSCIC
jgi:hypothetical protein